MTRNTRPVSWIKAAEKDFLKFPAATQREGRIALTIAADGAKADIAKPLKGFGAGVLEIVLKHRGDAYRVVYAVKIDTDVWVIHAFQKKSKKGIATPKAEIDVVKSRLKQLKELLK